jgi:salicylate hydroxylase
MEKLNELSHSESWISEGSHNSLLESFADFPSWVLELFKVAPELALWQMRDIHHLDKWINGQLILVGDAAHAMLPTQGQGASQSIEDAEALQAFFADIAGRSSRDLVHERLKVIFEARHERASLIQAYSRQQAQPGTVKGSESCAFIMTVGCADVMRASRGRVTHVTNPNRPKFKACILCGLFCVLNSSRTLFFWQRSP